jgi:membrane protease YdiL (CAAX protease family)
VSFLVSHSPSRIKAEIAIVLGLSLGLSALYALVGIIRRLSIDTPLREQTATINRSLDEQPWFDFTYQILGIVGALAPVALVVFLLWSPTSRLAALGVDGSRSGRDIGVGVGLAALIGIPGLAVYAGGVALGVTVSVVPTALEDYWWTIPVLLLRALTAGLVEETIAVGYLHHRLTALAFSPVAIIVIQALLRGTYHLYQGFGAFVGNVLMGLIFGWYFHRTRRLGPLIAAHTLIDAVAFVGYPVISDNFPEILGFAL